MRKFSLKKFKCNTFSKMTSYASHLIPIISLFYNNECASQLTYKSQTCSGPNIMDLTWVNIKTT